MTILEDVEKEVKRVNGLPQSIAGDKALRFAAEATHEKLVIAYNLLRRVK